MLAIIKTINTHTLKHGRVLALQSAKNVRTLNSKNSMQNNYITTNNKIENNESTKFSMNYPTPSDIHCMWPLSRFVAYTKIAEHGTIEMKERLAMMTQSSIMYKFHITHITIFVPDANFPVILKAKHLVKTSLQC